MVAADCLHKGAPRNVDGCRSGKCVPQEQGGKKASAQNWPMDDLEMLVKSKFPGAEPYEIQAEKFVDEVMVGRFIEKQFELGAVDDILSEDRWDSPEAQVLLAYVRYN